MNNSQAKDVYIITGASRGLGRALAEKLAGPNSVEVLINRGAIAPLAVELRRTGAEVVTVKFDLLQINKIKGLMASIFAKLDLKKARTITLINNAGTVVPIGLAGDKGSDGIVENLSLNAVAPIAMSHEFIARTKNFKGRRLIVNVSTGAAKRPIEGWSSYCSAKAALEMFTQCVAKEQETATNGVRVVSIDPGAMDTGMQSEIRRQKKKDFPLVDKFIEWHSTGVLKKPEDAAGELSVLINAELGSAL